MNKASVAWGWAPGGFRAGTEARQPRQAGARARTACAGQGPVPEAPAGTAQSLASGRLHARCRPVREDAAGWPHGFSLRTGLPLLPRGRGPSTPWATHQAFRGTAAGAAASHDSTQGPPQTYQSARLHHPADLCTSPLVASNIMMTTSAVRATAITCRPRPFPGRVEEMWSHRDRGTFSRLILKTIPYRKQYHAHFTDKKTETWFRDT